MTRASAPELKSMNNKTLFRSLFKPLRQDTILAFPASPVIVVTYSPPAGVYDRSSQALAA
jgi:hypothetical protein